MIKFWDVAVQRHEVREMGGCTKEKRENEMLRMLIRAHPL